MTTMGAASDSDVLPVGSGTAAMGAIGAGGAWSYASALAQGQAPEADLGVAPLPGPEGSAAADEPAAAAYWRELPLLGAVWPLIESAGAASFPPGTPAGSVGAFAEQIGGAAFTGADLEPAWSAALTTIDRAAGVRRQQAAELLICLSPAPPDEEQRPLADCL